MYRYCACAEVTKNITCFSMSPKRRNPTVAAPCCVHVPSLIWSACYFIRNYNTHCMISMFTGILALLDFRSYRCIGFQIDESRYVQCLLFMMCLSLQYNRRCLTKLLTLFTSPLPSRASLSTLFAVPKQAMALW